MDLLSEFLSREDYHQSIAYAKVMQSIGWSVIPLGGAQVFIRQIGPINFAKLQRPRAINFKKLRDIQARLHIIQTIIEPKSSRVLLKKNGYSLSSQRYAYTKTAILDIAPTLADIIAMFPSKTRYNYRISTRPINSYETLPFYAVTKEDRESFFVLHDAWSKERNIIGFSNKFLGAVMDGFRNSGWLIRAHTNGEFSGALMLLIHDRVGYYFYTFTSQQGRRAQVPTGLALSAISLSKDHDADIFDFCSIYDDRFPKDNIRWKGFSEFKSRFSPVEVCFPASFSRWL